MKDELQYFVWLSSLPGLNTVKAIKLLKYFKTAKEIWNAQLEDLISISFLNKNDIRKLQDKKLRENLKIHLEKIYKNNIQVISIYDDLYPDFLKNIYDPPVVIYVKGNINKEDKNIAIVGSRKASSYGLKMAEKISQELSNLGFTIVSGMARGIDSYAHKAAVNNHKRTIAVLGCGLDTVYPKENKKLMDEIIETGAVISEYLPGMPPLAQNFPARNRIISGLSFGVVVIEAGQKSGSLITTNFALEQGREVFALPGNLSSINSVGTNKLIKDGAKIVTGIEDILEEIKIFDNEDNNKKYGNIISNNTSNTLILRGLEGEERTIVEVLLEESLHIDTISQKTGISPSVTSATIVMLELKGIIEQMPGKIFKVKNCL